MTVVAIAVIILLGIVTLVGVWYNGKKHGEQTVQAETLKVGADTAAEHVQALEEAREQEHEAARQKDLDEAKAVRSDDDAADFLVHSH